MSKIIKPNIFETLKYGKPVTDWRTISRRKTSDNIGSAISGGSAPPDVLSNISAQNTTINRLATSALINVYDNISGQIRGVVGYQELSSPGLELLSTTDSRESGWPSSRSGRRYTCKSPNMTGVAAATGFVTTTPTFLLVAGATNELTIRRVTVSLPLIGTSTTFRAGIKTDTADRFSAGGTARAPVTMNNGNAVATTVARNLETPTATAEGGGTRDVDVKSGNITSGSVIEFNFKDGLIIAASGSFLLYVVTATAGATIDYVIEFEDANIQ